MKIRRTALGLSFVLLVLTVALLAAPREEQWKEVQEAVGKGLPKTAIAKLEPIIESALKDKDYDEAIKALGQKVHLEGTIQGNKPEEKITRWEAEIAKAPAPMKPVMEAVLANWYWQYFQQNRWRFMQRTQTAAPPSDDFTTWPLARILAEIDEHFQTALASADELKKIPVSEYTELLERGNAPDAYRPTLFDFLAHEALAFYTSAEQAGAKPENAFDLKASSPVFGAREEFLAWEVETTDNDSSKVKAIRLLQSLVSFHVKDDDPAALLDVDLIRLEFGNNTAFGEEKNARYKAALRRFAEKHGDHRISARALHNLATVIHSEGDWVEARNIAKQGLAQHENSVGGRRCFNLIQQIEARELQITTERVWNAPFPTIDIQYRNITKLYFRAVPFDFETYAKSSQWGPENLPQPRDSVLKLKPVHEWSVDLPATEDFQRRTEQTPAPEKLPKGPYYIVASHKEDFGSTDNVVAFSEMWVSDLALVTRNRHNDGVVGGQLFQALTGAPVPGAKVRAWRRSQQNNRFTPLGETKTDKDGLFQFDTPASNGVIFHAQHGDDQLSTINHLYSYRNNNQPVPDRRTVFFTDRALYRPGQTIQFKGICILVDQKNDNYAATPGRQVTVQFSDVNGKPIEKLDLKANAYGSISGSFTAPRDRLMGRMSIRVEGEQHSVTQVTVEEYKRPKFQVELAAPKTAARLSDDVSLQGKATAYTGAAIDGALVNWRVVRQVSYPYWWYWRGYSPRNTGAQEIAHGTSSTEVDGAFTIDFVAKPDTSVAEESGATFTYSITADVTDTTGETRSAQRTIRVGFTALQASVHARGSWLTDEEPIALTVSTTTLDNEPQAATGTLEVLRLKQPETVQRPSYSGYRPPVKEGEKASPNPADPNTWELGESVHKEELKTGADGAATASVELQAGYYRARFETQDRFGKPVETMTTLRVLDPDAKRLSLKIPDLLDAKTWSVEPGEEFRALWGSGYDKAQAYVEIEHRGKILQSYWTDAKRTQVAITQKVDESMRGGFTLRVTFVHENRAYLHVRRVEVPWSNKNLTVKWEHFVSKLKPGQQETWTALIQGPDAENAIAELVAGMYDASLDAYQPHHWAAAFNVFRRDYANLGLQFENQRKGFQYLTSSWSAHQRNGSLTYRHFPQQIFGNFYQYQWGYFQNGRNREMQKLGRSDAKRKKGNAEFSADKNSLAQSLDTRATSTATGGPDLSQVKARTNLNETAFFYPHLISDENGMVKLEFTMPEALTEWKFFGFAHDNELRAGLLTDSAVTAKDLMIQPNPPRFVREGDEIEFTVKVSNQSPTRQTGTVRLNLLSARTNDSVDAAFGNKTLDQSFEIPAKESRTYAWRIKVPNDADFLIYRAVGSTGKLSDGEEGYLPVLSRRILVTESVTLPIRGEQVKKFDFEKLLQSGGSKTLDHRSLTVQMVSNPSWYAVMALPYLMEYPHECSEQTFNRLYANTLARHIANSDPKIRRVFDQWRGTPSLDSPLEQNQDLKAVMIEETPWLREAQNESQARRNVAILFDDNRLNQETARLLRKLAEQQLENGAWPWFPGGPANDFITLYITTGFGRLRHLGAEVDVAPAVKSLTRLDAWADRMYREALKHHPEKNHLSTTIALYLYGRSFFLDDQAIAPEHQDARNYWLGQARKYWLQLNCRQSQGHLAIALKRFGDKETPVGIMASIKERSVTSEELGMFWRDLELSYWWFRAPIETQAVMIEAFDEVVDDQEAVEECKVWLLKQKQTQNWKTTKATADAVYALLLRGTDVLASNEIVQVTLGGKPVKPASIEAGTGFYEQRFAGGEVSPQQGRITVTKADEGVAWGSVHWQYLEDIGAVTEQEGGPLKLSKALFIKRNSEDGPVLEAVKGPVKVGDELVVRIVLRSDRDMEYLHLKDYRGSGTEPVNVLSRYKYQDGLAYYESTRDTASHFFIDYLPKGTYVFEYSTRVQLRGEYESGVASIQCMYAPEFNSHSASVELEVK